MPSKASDSVSRSRAPRHALTPEPGSDILGKLVENQVLTRSSSKAPPASCPSQSWRRVPLLFTIALFSACASSAPPVEEELPSAEGYFQRAMEKLEGQRILFLFTDVDYPGAITLFQEVIDNYPYSEYALRAELKIADVHFERGDYEEAASFYQDFVELHPSHEKVPYAIYRNGICAFRRMRAENQDRTPAEDALAHFQVLLDRFPDSELAPDAELRTQEVKDRLARADVAIGDFYFQRGEFFSAILRYREALTKYPQHSERLRTLALLGMSLQRMRRYDEAERLYHQVLAQELDDDDLIDRVRTELAVLEGQGFGEMGGTPARSCVTDPNPSCE